MSDEKSFQELLNQYLEENNLAYNMDNVAKFMDIYKKQKTTTKVYKSKQEESQYYLSLANDSFQKQAKLKYLQKAIEFNPNNFEAKLLRLNLLSSKEKSIDDYKTLETECQKYLDMKGIVITLDITDYWLVSDTRNYITILYNLAKLNIEAKNEEQAKYYLEQIIKLNPNDNYNIHDKLALLYLNADEYNRLDNLLNIYKQTTLSTYIIDLYRKIILLEDYLPVLEKIHLYNPYLIYYLTNQLEVSSELIADILDHNFKEHSLEEAINFYYYNFQILNEVIQSKITEALLCYKKEFTIFSNLTLSEKLILQYIDSHLLSSLTKEAKHDLKDRNTIFKNYKDKDFDQEIDDLKNKYFLLDSRSLELSPLGEYYISKVNESKEKEKKSIDDLLNDFYNSSSALEKKDILHKALSINSEDIELNVLWIENFEYDNPIKVKNYIQYLKKEQPNNTKTLRYINRVADSYISHLLNNVGDFKLLNECKQYSIDFSSSYLFIYNIIRIRNGFEATNTKIYYDSILLELYQMYRNNIEIDDELYQMVRERPDYFLLFIYGPESINNETMKLQYELMKSVIPDFTIYLKELLQENSILEIVEDDMQKLISAMYTLNKNNINTNLISFLSGDRTLEANIISLSYFGCFRQKSEYFISDIIEIAQINSIINKTINSYKLNDFIIKDIEEK